MDLKPGYKQTEVGVIPEDWAVKLLGDVASFSTGKGLLKGEIQTIGRIPAIPYTSLYTDFAEVLDYGKIQWFVDDEAVGQMVSEPCVLIASSSNMEVNTGKASALTRATPVSIGREVIIIKSESDSAYLAYQLSTNAYRRRTLALARGTTIKHVYTATFYRYPIALPTLAEQKAIAGALSDADALIDSLEQLIAKKRLLKQGAMQDLLTCKRRLPGFEGEWEVLPLREGISLLSGHHVLAQFCNSDGSGYPYLTGPSDFSDGMIRHTKFTTNPATICRARDILITVKGSGVGTMVMSDGEYCISRQLMAIRVSDDWDAIFVFFSLLQDATLIGAAATGLIPGITRGDLLEKQMPIPSLPEQSAIAAILSDMDAEIAALESKLTKARQVKQGMMQELLTGRTRLI